MVNPKITKEQESQINDIIENLSELSEDPSVPKNVRIKIVDTINSLKEPVDLSIKINKALHYLDEVGDDINLQSYTRTQIWNIVSLLEKIQ